MKSLQTVRDFAQTFGRRRLLVRTDLQSAAVLAASKRGSEAAELQAGRSDWGTGRDWSGRFSMRETQWRHSVGLSGSLDERLDEAEMAYLKDLHDRSAESRTRQPNTARASAAGDQINLTPREAEILALICNAMPNKRIALALDITLETVKWNVKNILAKLGVSNRYDAITRAREAGLVK